LATICIPSSIETICESSFSHCERLASVTFEPGGRVSSLGESTFVNSA
jgi:hypothetical protein